MLTLFGTTSTIDPFTQYIRFFYVELVLHLLFKRSIPSIKYIWNLVQNLNQGLQAIAHLRPTWSVYIIKLMGGPTYALGVPLKYAPLP